MGRDNQKMLLERDNERFIVDFVWTISKGRDTYGYNICTAFVEGQKVGQVNGGGYDMQGASLSGWIASKVKPDAEFYGLSWHNPNYKKPVDVQALEDRGESFGLEAYQAFYKASSKTKTDVHVIPLVDGACGLSTVLSGAGFTYWSIHEYKPNEVKEYLQRWSEDKVTPGNWQAVARRHGFKPGRRTRGGSVMWERWPEQA